MEILDSSNIVRDLLQQPTLNLLCLVSLNTLPGNKTTIIILLSFTITKLDHQQKKFYLMYYIHIFLYGLVIQPPLIPPIPPVFTSCSKARGGLLEAPYIPTAPFILIVVRGPRLAPLANWSRLTDPCFFLLFHPGHFGRWTASSCLCASGKTLAWLGALYHTWHFLFPLISPLWIPSLLISPLWILSPLISPLWILSPWGCSPGHTMHPRPLYRSHKPLPFLMYAYQVGSLPLFAEPHALCASYRPCRALMVRLR